MFVNLPHVLWRLQGTSKRSEWRKEANRVRPGRAGMWADETLIFDNFFFLALLQELHTLIEDMNRKTVTCMQLHASLQAIHTVAENDKASVGITFCL
eukprot:g63209.t1